MKTITKRKLWQLGICAACAQAFLHGPYFAKRFWIPNWASENEVWTMILGIVLRSCLLLAVGFGHFALPFWLGKRGEKHLGQGFPLPWLISVLALAFSVPLTFWMMKILGFVGDSIWAALPYVLYDILPIGIFSMLGWAMRQRQRRYQMAVLLGRI